MNTDSSFLIKKSFSIENILSKPDTNNKKQIFNSIVCDSKIDGSNGTGDLVADKIVPKLEPISDVPLEQFDENYCFDEESAKRRPSSFTSPDSSGCEEEIVDNLSDITNDETRKLPNIHGNSNEHNSVLWCDQCTVTLNSDSVEIRFVEKLWGRASFLYEKTLIVTYPLPKHVGFSIIPAEFDWK